MQHIRILPTLGILCAAALLARAAPHDIVVLLLGGHEIVYREYPYYPQHAVDQRWQGRGILRLHVRSNGSVSMITFVKSTGYETLDNAAREAFSRWRFQPEKAAFTVEVPCSFRLGDAGGTRIIVRPAAPPKKA
jgi:periplasmic protein TonB